MLAVVVLVSTLLVKFAEAGLWGSPAPSRKADGKPQGGTIPPHSHFSFKEGIIEVKDSPKLRLNVKGGDLKEGDPVVLWPCSPQNNEIFEMEAGLIRLGGRPDQCLNAEGGVGAGHRIITWPCPPKGAKPDENMHFQMGADGLIRMAKHPHMCINIKESNIEGVGGEVILWTCSESAMSREKNEVFEFKDGLIRLKANPDLHFNVHGGMNAEEGEGKHVVLWQCNAGPHEQFEFHEGNLRLKSRPDLCLNAEGGLNVGAKIIAWPCQDNANEKWSYDPDLSVIYSTKEPTLGFNAAGGALNAGDEVVLWPLHHVAEEL